MKMKKFWPWEAGGGGWCPSVRPSITLTSWPWFQIYPLISSLVIITMLCILTVSSMPEFLKYRVVKRRPQHNASGTSEEIDKDNNVDEITPLDAVALFCLAFFATELLVYLIFYCLEIILRRKPTLTIHSLRPIIILDIITIAAWALFIFRPLTHAAFNIIVYMVIPLRSFRIVWFLRLWNPGRGLTYILETKWKSLVLVLFALVLVGDLSRSLDVFCRTPFYRPPWSARLPLVVVCNDLHRWLRRHVSQDVERTAHRHPVCVIRHRFSRRCAPPFTSRRTWTTSGLGGSIRHLAEGREGRVMVWR